MITQRGASLGMGALALWALGRFFGIAELYVVAAAAATLVIAALVGVRMSTASVAVRRSLPTTRLLNGGSAEVQVDLRNDALTPAPILMVEDAAPVTLADRPRFVVPGIQPGRTRALRYRIDGRERGRYTLGPVRLRVRDPFGLAERLRRYSATDEVLVWPRIEALPAGIVRAGHRSTGQSTTRRVFAVGDEFYTMREYATGDDLRLVHWPSTARHGRLMVRQQEQPWEARATVLLDTRRGAHQGAGPSATLEHAISAAASVVWHLADLGYDLRLATEVQPERSGALPWSQMLDRLAEVEASSVPSLVPILGRLRADLSGGLLVTIIAPPPRAPAEPAALGRHPEVRALLQAGRGATGRIAVVVPGRGPAATLVDLLRTAGWRAVLLDHEGTAAAWGALGRAPLRARADAAAGAGAAGGSP